MLGRNISLFNLRYQCLKLVKSSTQDFTSYATIVNNCCEDFKIKEMSDDQFKCPMFVCGFQNHDDSDIRTKLLSKIDTTLFNQGSDSLSPLTILGTYNIHNFKNILIDLDHCVKITQSN